MSDRVEQHEVQAILDAVDSGAGARLPADVQPRNFRQPRRLSRERLQYLAQLVTATLNGVGQSIAAPLRQHHKISLASISEVSVLGLFNGYEPPFLVDVFECGGHVSWVLWDSAAASAAVEMILSGPPSVLEDEQAEPQGEVDEDEEPPTPEPSPSRAHEARLLSASECRVIESLLDGILSQVAGAFGLEVSGGRLAQEPEEVTSLEDCGPDADPRRLMLHFLFEGPGGPSDIRVYLPDVGEEDPVTDAGGPKAATPLPEHFAPVRLDLAAYLASVDVPLSDLMALEVGDVIPLGVEVGSQVAVYIEDRCCARGTWGRHRGLHAVRVDDLDPRPGEIEEPTH